MMIIPLDLELGISIHSNLSGDHPLVSIPESKKGQPLAIVLLVLGGPYRGRTGDLHNAIVALSQTELTAQSF